MSVFLAHFHTSANKYVLYHVAWLKSLSTGWIDELNNEHWLLWIISLCLSFLLHNKLGCFVTVLCSCYKCFWHKYCTNLLFSSIFFLWCLFFHIVMVSNVGSEPLTVCPEMSCGEVTKIWLWCVDSVTAALEWCESPASAFMLDTKIFYTERLIKNQSWIIVVQTLVPNVWRNSIFITALMGLQLTFTLIKLFVSIQWFLFKNLCLLNLLLLFLLLQLDCATSVFLDLFKQLK